MSAGQGMIYRQAAVSGMGALEIATTGSNARTRAAYDAQYQASTQKLNLQKSIGVAQKNIAAINQDKIISNTQIQMKQDQAEASAKVSAAFAGVEGSSVDAVIQDTRKNEAHRVAALNKQAEQNKQNYLAQIGTSQSALLAVEEPEINYVGELLNIAGNINHQDVKNFGNTYFGGGEDSNEALFLEAEDLALEMGDM